MAEIRQQPVGDVDGRAGQTAQRLTGRQPRLRPQIGIEQRMCQIAFALLPAGQPPAARPG